MATKSATNQQQTRYVNVKAGFRRELRNLKNSQKSNRVAAVGRQPMTLLRQAAAGRMRRSAEAPSRLILPSAFFADARKDYGKPGKPRNHFATESPARPAATQEIQPRINTDGHGSEVIAHPCPSVSICGKNSSRKCTTLNYCVTKSTKTDRSWKTGQTTDDANPESEKRPMVHILAIRLHFTLLDLATRFALRFGHESVVCACRPGFAGVVPVSLSVTGPAGLSAGGRLGLRNARRKGRLAQATGQRPVGRLPAGFR